jgi:hypothetical protein
MIEPTMRRGVTNPTIRMVIGQRGDFSREWALGLAGERKKFGHN